MFTRNVQFQIKSGKGAEFKTLVEKEVLPLLKSQAGFKNEVILVDADRVLGISFWEDKKHLETYENTAAGKLMEKMQPLMEGAPTVKKFQVASTTLAA